MAYENGMHKYPILALAANPNFTWKLPEGVRLRHAGQRDVQKLRRGSTGLEYAQLAAASPGRLLVAVADEKIVGVAHLHQHGEAAELSCLEVIAACRGKGLGQALVGEHLRGFRGKVFINTIIPGFFAPLGFERVAADIPAFLVKDDEWCGDCPREKCQSMVLEQPEEVPAFPHMRQLNWRDQALFWQVSAYDPGRSSYVDFMALHTYRECERPLLTRLQGNLCILLEGGPTGSYFVQPVGAADMEATVLSGFAYLRENEQHLVMRKVSGSFLDRYQLRQSSAFDVQPDRDSADYVYDRERLAAFAGRRLHRPKNKYNRFRKRYGLNFEMITPDNLGECIRFVTWWFDANQGKCIDSPGVRSATLASLADLFRYERAQGALLRVEGKIVALTIGRPAGDGTVIIHTELADARFSGACQAICKLFCATAWEGYPSINRMEDLGVEGLRFAKLSYRPQEIIEVFNLLPKN